MQAMLKSSLVLMLALSGSGCMTMHARPSDASAKSATAEKPAHVISDYRVRAGAPVNVFLRSVDDQHLNFWQHAADIEPGLHRLLVDCSVVAVNKLSRHELNVTLDAGVRYRLTAEANDQQGCTRVILEELE